jgi:hypothetical protein
MIHPWPNKSFERPTAPLLRSALGGNSGVPRALHRPCRRRSLTLVVSRKKGHLHVEQ